MVMQLRMEIYCRASEFNLIFFPFLIIFVAIFMSISINFCKFPPQTSSVAFKADI